MWKTLKKLAASLGLVALLMSVISSASFAAVEEAPFPDVGIDHEYVTSINYMKDNLVFTGYPDGSYQPDRVLNRAEQLKVYMVLHGLDPDPDVYKDCFSDVGTEWFAPFVCLAEEQGWVVGYSDGTFRPSQEVNKVEAIKMLGEVQGWVLPEVSEAPFDDTPVDEWYTPYVLFAKEAGLLVEDEDEFGPGEGLARGVTSEVLFRSLAVYALEDDMYETALEEDILALAVNQITPPVLIVVGNWGTAPEAEFGDAPDDGLANYVGSYSTIDAKFPTLYNTINSLYGPGAHALDSSMEYLGDPVIGGGYSYELDADDPADPDGLMNLVNDDDFDDGVVGLNVLLTQIPPPTVLTVDVTVHEDAPDVPRYLNALIDLNMDGMWKGYASGGEPEWVVQNYVVNVDPGVTERITVDEFAYANGMLLPPSSWMRVVLSRDPIDASEYRNQGWDGSGVFEFGEVEDYFVELPPVGGEDDDGDDDDDDDGDGGGLVWGKPAPVMVCPNKVIFPTGVNVVSFTCAVANYGGRGDADYDFWWISGGVSVLPASGRVTLATAPPGFPPFGVVGNPIFVRQWAFRGNTPSTWGYEVVGVDPDSYVVDNVVKLGLVAQEKDEGYEAGDFEDFVTWSDSVADAYLFEDGATAPVILDAVLFEMDATDIDEDYYYKVMADAASPTDDSLTYGWSSPVGCGMLSDDGNMLEWKFDEVDANECMTGGLALSVSDGEETDIVVFDDLFTDDMIPEPVVNEAPVVEDIVADWLNLMEDDPHVYDLTVYAVDPENQNMTYNWTSVDCGNLTADTDMQTVEWQYAVADMESCGAAQVTVEVTDSEGATTTHTASIF